MPFPTPHLEKLNAVLDNEKLDPIDKPRLQVGIERYKRWIADLDKVTGAPDARLRKMVELLNEYRLWVDVDLVFDSPHDFLYRQKGQLKLDSSIIEEFLPRLVQPALFPEMHGLMSARRRASPP